MWLRVSQEVVGVVWAAGLVNDYTLESKIKRRLTLDNHSHWIMIQKPEKNNVIGMLLQV